MTSVTLLIGPRKSMGPWTHGYLIEWSMGLDGSKWAHTRGTTTINNNAVTGDTGGAETQIPASIEDPVSHAVPPA